MRAIAGIARGCRRGAGLLAFGRTRITVDPEQIARFRRLLSARMDPGAVDAATVSQLAAMGWDLACTALEGGSMDNGEAAPDTVYRWSERPKLVELEDRVRDLRSHCAHLEDVAGALQARLAVLETTMGRVLTLAAAVDSSGRTNVAQELARRTRMEEVRNARAAETAPRGDRSDAGDGGRLTPCPVAERGLEGIRGGSGGIGEDRRHG